MGESDLPVFKAANMLYEYGKYKNISVENVYGELLEFLKNENGINWNITELSQKFLNNTAEIIQYNGSLNYSNFTPEEWKYYNVLEQFYTYSMKFSNKLDWTIKNVGSFFIKSLRYDILKKDKNRMDKIHQLFTISGQNISLPDLAQMYTTMDFRELRQFSYNCRNGLSSHEFLEQPNFAIFQIFF